MFEKLKSLFIVDDEEFKRKATGLKDAPNNTVPEKKSAESASQPVSTPKSNTSMDATGGVVSDKFTNILLAAIEKGNTEEFDYLEFRNSLNSLKKMDMDEATRFKSAFAMAQTMNTTNDKLISSAERYLQILAKEEQKFGQALVNQRDRQIGEKQNQLGQLDQAIRAKAEQIKKLSADIEKAQAQMQQVESELQTASGKVERTKMNFVASYRAIVSQIQGDVEKMQQYLK